MLIQIQNQACFLKHLFIVAENGEEHVAAVNGVAKTLLDLFGIQMAYVCLQQIKSFLSWTPLLSSFYFKDKMHLKLDSTLSKKTPQWGNFI